MKGLNTTRCRTKARNRLRKGEGMGNHTTNPKTDMTTGATSIYLHGMLFSCMSLNELN